MMSNPQMIQMMSNPQMMQALGGIHGLPAGTPNPALANGDAGAAQPPTTTPPGAGAGGANPMAAMMQDPAMMQAAMQMMGGAAPAHATPGRCACGNFESGRGDGLCNACRNR